LVGWLLHEFSDLFKIRREDKRALGRVLAELLEVRTRLQAIPAVMKALRERIPLAAHDEAMLRHVFDNFFPVGQIQERYNQAIDSMAGRLPLLAYRLRSRDIVTPVLSQLRALALNDPQAVAIIGKAEDEAIRLVMPNFDELALELARLHSWVTWWRLRSRLREPAVIPNEVNEFISYGLAEAQKAVANAQPPQPAQNAANTPHPPGGIPGAAQQPASDTSLRDLAIGFFEIASARLAQLNQPFTAEALAQLAVEYAAQQLADPAMKSTLARGLVPLAQQWLDGRT